MALTVEDGSIVTDANTYASAAGFNTYLSSRGKSLSGLNGTVEQLLLKAMDYLEPHDFIGYKSTKAQPLQWPRTDVTIDGFSLETDEIPDDLVYAQIEIAIAMDEGNDPLAAQARTTQKEKVGDIEVEYASDAKDTVELVAVNTRLNKLVKNGTSGGVVTLERG